jgi:putative transposase
MVTACLESRSLLGRMLYHALNQGNRREAFFHKPGDYDASVEAMIDVCIRVPLDLLDINALCPCF